MENSSSSSSGLEGASMDDSEQEQEYDYDIDDAEEDAHDDYEDIPEEDDDDDDDDDDFQEPGPIVTTDLATTLRGFASDARLFYNGSEAFHHAFPLRARQSPNGLHFDNFISVDPSFVLPGRDDAFHTVLLDSFDTLSDPARMFSNLDSVRLDAPFLSSRVRASLPVFTSRLPRADTPSSVHPQLAPPRVSLPVGTNDLLTSLARRSNHLASILERAPLTNASSDARAHDALHAVAEATGATSDYVPSTIPRARDDRPLTDILQADLMRSVALAPAVESSLASFSRQRTFERAPTRDTERVRDKVPSQLARRWRYEPVLAGGDVLPPMFDPENLHHRSSGSPSRNDRAGLGYSSASDVAKPIAQVAAKVSQLLEGMLVDLWTVQQTVVAGERKIEDKKKKKDSVTVANASEGDPQTDRASVPASPTREDSDIEADVDSNPDGDDGGEAEAHADGEGEGEEVSDPGLEAEANAEHEGQQRRQGGDMPDLEPLPTLTELPPPPAPPLPPADLPAVDANATPEETAAQPAAVATAGTSRFSLVATQRAAAAGISLDAPASENPEVVAAATRSTGIDPAFLAALPDEMRTEILTQSYDQIRTNTAAAAATGGSGSGSGSGTPLATSVNQDFLIALPPALRAEVLELEAEFQSRQEGESADVADGARAASGEEGAEGEGGIAAAEMDNATFLATLPPDLREEILLTYDESFIQSLPPNVIAEARVLRERRESSSRLPWRVGRGDFDQVLGDGNDGFTPGYAPPTSRMLHSRRGERSAPRETPVYKWKKVGEHWLREGPNAANEPPVSMKRDGLSSLVRILWNRNGSYGKTALYHVLSHMCKSTESRFIILDELIQLITSNPEAGSSADAPSPGGMALSERSRFHGTAVRRGLEVLTMLCKNDSVVAESLLGLPKTESALEALGTTDLDEEGRGTSESTANMSTLLKLLGHKLFTRSVSHLEQLIVVLSAIAQSAPSCRVNGGHEKSRGRRVSSRNRSFFDRQSLAPGMGDPMLLYVGMDDEQSGMPEGSFEPDEDGSTEEGDLRYPPARFGRMRSARTPSGSSTRDGQQEETESTKTIVPVVYRVPSLDRSDAVRLTQVLLRSGCEERTYDRLSRAIGVLGELQSNREVFMNALVGIAKNAGSAIRVEYERFLGSGVCPIGDSFLLGCANNDVTLLRVVKSLAGLLKFQHDRPGDQSGLRRTLVVGLEDMWAALDRVLERIAGVVKSKERAGSGKASAKAHAIVADKMKGGSGGLSPMLARLSPMIEAFLVTHCDEEDGGKAGGGKDGKDGAKDGVKAPGKEIGKESGKEVVMESGRGMSIVKEVDGEKTLDERLAAFVERHRDGINSLLRANAALLESSFKGVLRHPHAIDFDNKKAYFRNVIRKRSSEAHAGTIRISVRRDRVFDDSYQQLRMRNADEMKGRLHVQFTNEEGVDAGGVTREWFAILARQIFDPNYVLFTRSAAKAATYQPDKRSYINKEHLENFRFVGRIIGKAIYDGQLIDAYFTRSFYKHILGLPITFHDIEGQDPEYYKSLKWMLDNDITGILEYTMSAEFDEFGKQTVLDLLADGRNVAVTEANKAEYVKLVTEVRMTKSIEKQIAAFKEGFYEMIPLEDCKIFNELELELLMSGLPDIDVADLKANVEYTGYTSSSPQVYWFWKCVSKMDQEDLARLVMFVTGTSKVPLEGFSQLQGMSGVQKFQIHRVGGSSLRLPSAHTCFNQIDLPEYSSADILSERLLRAVRECSVGFGFA